MRVCPKCGYVDPAYWRHSRFDRWRDFTELENFKIMVERGLYPKELLEELQKNRKAEGKCNVFRLSKAGYVYRYYKHERNYMRSYHGFDEKPVHKPRIRKLEEVYG